MHARRQPLRRCHLDLSCGEGAAERLDLFPADGNARAPVILFVHGGGWRASSKSERSFPADLFAPAGAVWISVEYPLAPAASGDEMSASVRRAVAWAHRNVARFGGDPDRLFVAGNSAGAPILCAVGRDETAVFHHEAAAFVAAWRRRGCQAEALIVDGNHFSIIGDLGDGTSALAQRMLAELTPTAGARR